jgi:glycerol-3-phosphate dehydrogenase
MEGKTLETEVTIIGGGFTGVTIARELSKYKVDVVLVERGGELAAGASKATLGHIYTGLNMVGSMILKSVVLPPGTPLTVEALHDSKALISQWSEQGFDEWRHVLDELDVKHRDSHLLIVAKDDSQIEDLKKYITLGQSAGGVYGDFRQIDREEIFELEPNISRDIVTALYATKQVIALILAASSTIRVNVGKSSRNSAEMDMVQTCCGVKCGLRIAQDTDLYTTPS